MKKGIDYIGVTVVFYCHDGKGNLLLNKRSSQCRDEVGRWDCGGGAMKHGETFEEAVRREVKEEYCCDIIKLDYVTTNNVIRKQKGIKTHWIAILFACQVDLKQVGIGDPEKMEEIGWFALDKIPRPVHSMFKKHLKDVQKAGIVI